jgi:phosphatidate cytidylyltransferase
MLKQRIITAAILIPIFVFLVLKLPPDAFCIMTGAFVLVGAWEWSGFMGVKKKPQTLIYPLLMIFLMAASLYIYIPFMMYVAFAWWLIALLLMFIYPKASESWGNSIIVRGIMGVLVLIPCWLAINFIRNANDGPYALLFLFILIWTADIAAYFAGRQWGKHKLAAKLSPGKTWEGFMGALTATFLVVVGTLYALKAPMATWLGAIILRMVAVVFSVIGDLFESMLKRKAGLKDSGVILPGHGGVLDRIDSLTAAAPIFVVGSLILGKIYH